jgi:hypothetical protein
MCSVLHRRGTVILCKSRNTKHSELIFSAVLGSGASELRFERATLS